MNFGWMTKCSYCVTSSSRRIPDWPQVSRSSSAWDQKFSSWSGSVPSWPTVNLAMTSKQRRFQHSTHAATTAANEQAGTTGMSTEHDQWGCAGTGGGGVARKRRKEMGHIIRCSWTQRWWRDARLWYPWRAAWLGGMGWRATLGLNNGAHGTEPHLLSEIRPVGSVAALQTGNGETLQSTWSCETQIKSSLLPRAAAIVAQKLCVSPQNRSYYYCFKRSFIKLYSLVKISFIQNMHVWYQIYELVHQMFVGQHLSRHILRCAIFTCQI